MPRVGFLSRRGLLREYHSAGRDAGFQIAIEFFAKKASERPGMGDYGEAYLLIWYFNVPKELHRSAIIQQASVVLDLVRCYGLYRFG